jgi:hypothetical protein
VFDGKPSCELGEFVSIYGRGVFRGRQWKSSEKKKGMCSELCRPGAPELSLCAIETVAVSNIQR